MTPETMETGMAEEPPLPKPPQHRLRALHDAAKHIGLLADERDIARASVECARRAFGADAILLLRDETEPRHWPARACSQQAPDQPLPALTDLAIDRHCIVGAGAAIRVADMGPVSAEVRRCYRAYSFGPLEVGGDVVGLLGVRREATSLAAIDLELLCGLASVTAVAIAQSRERAHALREERGRARLSRYFSPQVTDYLLADECGELSAGVRLNATVLFCDIRGFTAFSEERDPREVFEFLNAYFREVIAVVLEAGGMVDKLMGDGLLAVFGAPLARADHAAVAAACALDMVKRIAQIPLGPEGGTAVRVGIGIDSGPVILGDLGGAGMRDFTVLGATVNLASRIESLTRKLSAEILLSAGCYAELEGSVDVEVMPPADVPGYGEPVRSYRLRALRR